MVSENWPTYVVLTLYVVATIVVTVAANRKNNDPSDASSQITKHFLGSKNFGPVILTFTTFASVFSGYTVVGVPNEAGSNGFTAVRWMSLIVVIGVSMLWLFPRLRRLSMVRGYQSPGEFISDRYKSKTLSILVALLTCAPQLLYIGINLYSLGITVDGLTGGELSFYPVVIASTIMILALEAAGGMRSVAYTDAVEAVVMVAVFVILPCMLASYVGGFVGQVNNSDGLTVPCDNSNDDGTSGCLNYAMDAGGVASEYYLRSPAPVTILNYALFSLAGISFSLNPHLTQRALTAKTDRDIRLTVVCIFLVTFVTMTPGLLTGISYISNKPDLKDEYPDLAFQATLAEFRDRGGFAAFISYVALLSGIAGIMSTADSALIGVSNTISVDIFKSWVTPQRSADDIVKIGKAVSLCTMVLCLLFAIYLWETEADYGVTYTIQQGLLWQAVPAFAFGLYTAIGNKAVLLGTSVGTVVDFILIGVLFAEEGKHDPFPTVDKSWSTFLGVALNVGVTVLAHYLLPDEIADTDSEQLSLSKMRAIMHGVSEPVTKWGGALVWLSLAGPFFAAFHWIGDGDAELDAVDGLLYNGAVRNVIAGLPDYIFASIMWYVVAVAVGVAATMTWTVDNEDDEEVTPKAKVHVAATSTGTDIEMETGSTQEPKETESLNNGTEGNGTEEHTEIVV